MTSVHLPFCDMNCDIEHCPLLICVLTTHRQNMAELSVCIESYKTRGWTISENIPDPCKDFQYPLLHWACALGKYSIVRWLVKEGFNPNLQTEAGDTALHRAIISLRSRYNKLTLRGLDSVVDLLSSNLSLANMKRQTPMLQLAHSLLKKEISVDYFSHWMICCTDAVINVSPEKRSTMTDAQDHDGNTVLHLMVQQPGILPSIKRIVNASASLQIRNKWGQTALDIASSSKSEEYIHHLTTASGLRCLSSKGDAGLVRSSPRLQVTPSCPTMDTCIQPKSVAVAISSPRKSKLVAGRDTTSTNIGNASPAEPVIKRSRKGSPHRRVTFDSMKEHLTGESELEEARISSLGNNASSNVVRVCVKREIEEDGAVSNEATSHTAESTSYTNDAMYSPDATTSDSSSLFEYLNLNPGFKIELVKKLEHDKQRYQAIINQEETIRLVEETELKQLLADIKHSDERIVNLLSQVEKLQSRTTDIQKKVDKLNQNSGERLEKVTKIKNKLLTCIKAMKEFEQENGNS